MIFPTISTLWLDREGLSLCESIDYNQKAVRSNRISSEAAYIRFFVRNDL